MEASDSRDETKASQLFGPSPEVLLNRAQPVIDCTLGITILGNAHSEIDHRLNLFKDVVWNISGCK